MHDVNTLLNFARQLLNLLRDLGINIIDFCMTEFEFAGASFYLIEILFGSALITYLAVKLVLALVQ